MSIKNHKNPNLFPPGLLRRKIEKELQVQQVLDNKL